MPGSGRPRRRVELTGRGICLGLAGGLFVATAVVFGRSDALEAGVTLFVALVLSGLVARLARPPATFVRTITSGTLAPGTSVEVELAPVPGSGPVPPPACVVDHTPWVEADVTPNRDGTALGYTFVAPGRGAYPIGPARITLPGPLGLVAASYYSAPPAELLVAPALVEVTVQLPDAESDLPQVRTQAGAERVTEPAAVRDYQSGDPRRLVHWKATARRDRLMVREVVLRGLPQAWVLVDDLSPADDAAERALSLSASVALRLLRTGHTVRLVRLDGRGAGESRFEPAGGPTPLLEAFARVQLPTPGTVGSPGMPGAVGAVGAVGGGGAVGQDGEDLTAALSHRLLSGVGTRGAVAPIYGALAQVSEQTAGELGRLASVARPGWLWLTGSSSEVETTLRRQGWTVEAAQ